METEPCELVAELDRRVGARRRSVSIAVLIRRALDDEQRWDDIEAALAAIDDSGHDWDRDPAAWVRRQRRGGAPVSMRRPPSGASSPASAWPLSASPKGSEPVDGGATSRLAV